MSIENEPMIFTGLDGANPLAFLAALGAFRALTAMARNEGSKAPKMSWRQINGVWNPLIKMESDVTQADFVTRLDVNLRKMANHSALMFAPNLQIPKLQFRQLTEGAVRSWLEGTDDVISAEFFSAFGTDGIFDDKGDIEDTALRTMSGGGNQHFVGFMNELAEGTSMEHLTEALFGPWKYQNGRPSLRFDPADDRRYAFRWDNPSTDPIRTVRGANRLAVEGIPMLPVTPVGKQLETTGFTGHRRNNTFWTWPIWISPISLDTTRSLLSLAILQGDKVQEKSKELTAMGIEAVFRTQRIAVGKYRNFTPTKQIA